MKIIGHRGAMGEEPENTLRAFNHALDVGVDMIELDVYALPSGEVVIIHDDDLDRTTNGHAPVMETPFTELRQLDAGQGEQIPTLQEALDLVDSNAKDGHRTPVNIELKGPNTANAVTAIINEYIAKGWQPEDFIVSSFRHDELRKFKAANPGIRVAVLINGEQWSELGGDSGRAVELAKGMGAVAVNPDLKFVDSEIVSKAHEAGLAVNVFTLVDDADVLRMAEMGVDGVFSNNPDSAQRALGAVSKK